jgi:serine/threonine-protein kinase
MQVLMAHLREAPRPPRELRRSLPADLEAIILRCLAKDPRDRFADAEALDRALAGCSAAGTWSAADAAAWWVIDGSARR